MDGVDSQGLFRCLVASCDARFSTSQTRDKHVDRHFRPRYLCSGGCGKWFHDLDTLRAHGVTTRECAKYYKADSVVYRANVRWERCSKHLLRQPTTAQDPMFGPVALVAVNELRGVVVSRTDPPKPVPVWPRRVVCKLPSRVYGRAE